MSGWMKFAIQGSTYARALQNRAERTHGAGNVDPSTFSSVATQPQARFDTDLSSYARQSGALPPTAQTRAMTDLAHHMPWAGDEHTTEGASAKAPARFDRLLDNRGLSQTTPGGHGALQQQINQSFGDPAEFRRSLYHADTQTNAPAAPQTNASAPGAMRARSAQPAAPTSVLPAPPAAPAVAPPRQFARAKFQMGKVGSFRTGLEALVEAL